MEVMVLSVFLTIDMIICSKFLPWLALSDGL